MGIKYCTDQKIWIVQFSKRHPVTRQAVNLRRQTISDNGLSRNIKSKAEAQRVFNQLVIEVEQKLHRAVTPTWNVVVEKYCTEMRNTNWSLKTADTYWLCLRTHTFDEWGERTIDQIATHEIRDLIHRRVGHRSASHQKNLLKFIRGAFRFAIEHNFISRNPVPEMKFRIGDKIQMVLTEGQVEAFLNKAKELQSEWYPYWCTALYTGMRSGELYALTWDKVNFETRKILVNAAWNNKDGFKDTKSGNDRLIEIAPNLIHLLKELKLSGQDSNFVLPRIDKWDKGEQARELRMFLTGMGLPRIRFHDLRATWATIMLSRGVEPVKVMIVGGWKDMKTMQIYIRKAGVNIEGTSSVLDLHNPNSQNATVLSLSPI